MLYNPQFETFDTLRMIKAYIYENNIEDEDKNILKSVFDECESPFVYNIETEEITNSEEDEESDEELPPTQYQIEEYENEIENENENENENDE